MIRTKTGTYTIGIMLWILGLLLDSSGSHIAQAFHHLAFLLGGVAIGIAIMRE